MSPYTGQNRWARLKRASPQELAVRGQQEMAKRWDYLLARAGKRFDVRSPAGAKRGLFFFSSGELEAILSELATRFPRRAEEIQDAGTAIRSHRFNLLGYENLEYGPAIDWHLDLIHRRRAPLKPWFKIRYLDFDEVGDSKITWELNRHQFLPTLAKAYRLTSDSRYAEELFRLWYDWRQANPYPLGINWASSLEVAFRSLSWIWVDHLLEGTGIRPASFDEDLLGSLALHGRHIEKYLSSYFSPNTHLLGEGVALFFLGTLYPAIPQAPRWKKRGWQIVEEQAARQVRPDGMHFEQSLHYHVYALDFFLHARILAAKNGISVPARFDDAMVRMLEVLATLGQAGTLPHFGDDDGGRLFDPARHRVEHLLDPLPTGAILFARGDFKSAAPLCEETLWLLGEKGVASFDSLPAETREPAAALSSSGIYVLADPRVPQQLVVDAGSLGAGRAGHGHADALSVQLSVGRREFLSDPGTFSYVSADIDRNRFRGTGAHNTLRIDGADQAEADGPFGWSALPRVGVETWQNTATFSLLVGQACYQRQSPAAVHERTIFHLKPLFWLVRDVVRGRGEHTLEILWHLRPGLDIKAVSPGSFLVRDRDGDESLALLSAEDHRDESSIETDDWSPGYGKRVNSRRIQIRRRAGLPAEFVTILVPARAVDADCGRLARIDSPGNRAPLHGYTYSAAECSHYFFFNDSGLEWSAGVWTSDARFLYCALGPTGELLRWIVSRGTFLRYDGSPLVRDGQRVEWREWRKPSAARAETSAEADKALLGPMSEKTNKAGDR